MTQNKIRLLVISNGHGEDVIAIRIVEQLRLIVDNLEITSLPIVGEGYNYKKNNIPQLCRVQLMPSGGFIYMGGNPLFQDIKGGLLKLTLEQIKAVRQWGKNGDYILAVGDIVPLLFAWLSNCKYFFVGTAKSEYYLRDDRGQWLSTTSWWEKKLGSVYLPWEQFLMKTDRSLAVFPRDTLTTKILQQSSINAYNFGNPMMDDLISFPTPNYLIPKSPNNNILSIALIPGSRIPESIANWQQIIIAVSSLIETLTEYSLEFLTPIAPSLNLQPFTEQLIKNNWQLLDTKNQIFKLQNAKLYLDRNAYSAYLHRSDCAIAMAGTATEQFIGLGKPAFIIPGKGPQFTYAFAEAQTRLLGCSIIMVNKPQEISIAIKNLFNNPQQLAKITHNGITRMGKAGAAKNIAQQIINLIKTN